MKYFMTFTKEVLPSDVKYENMYGKYIMTDSGKIGIVQEDASIIVCDLHVTYYMNINENDIIAYFGIPKETSFYRISSIKKNIITSVNGKSFDCNNRNHVCSVSYSTDKTLKLPKPDKRFINRIIKSLNNEY